VICDGGEGGHYEEAVQLPAGYRAGLVNLEIGDRLLPSPT